MGFGNAALNVISSMGNRWKLAVKKRCAEQRNGLESVKKKSPQNKFFILFDLFTLQFIYSETRQGRKSCQWFLTTLK